MRDLRLLTDSLIVNEAGACESIGVLEFDTTHKFVDGEDLYYIYRYRQISSQSERIAPLE